MFKLIPRSGGRWLVAAALLPLAAATASAQVSYRSQLFWGAEASSLAGQDVTTSTGGGYSASGTGYLMTTSGLPLNNGTAQAEFAASIGAVSVGTQIRYSTVLAGPAGGLVPVRITAHGLAEGNGYAPCCGTEQYSAVAVLRIGSNEQGSLVEQVASVSTGFLSQQFSFDQVVMVMPNTSLDVFLVASASTISPYQHTTTITARAFVDPQFTVDAAYASQYAFVGLPSAVPEPSAAAMLAAGLAGLVVVRRSRKRRP